MRKVKANQWRFGSTMWNGTERFVQWRKLAKRQANRLERRMGKNIPQE